MTEAITLTPGDAALPRPPGVFRRWLAEHPRAVDWTIVGTYLFGCALMMLFEVVAGFVATDFEGVEPEAVSEMQALAQHLVWPWTLMTLLIVALVATALRFRRRFPLAGLIVVSLLMVFEQGLLVAPNSVALVFLLYAVPVYRSVAMGWIGYGVAVIVNSLLILVVPSGSSGAVGPAGIAVADPVGVREGLVLVIINALWLLAVLMIAINLGNRRRYIEALIDRAHQLARDREQKAQLAAAAERARIAREMHDIVAHSLSVVVTLSEAASVAIDAEPVAAKQAMDRAAETGRSALTEMRRLLGVLNEDRGPATSTTPSAAPLAPQPGAAQLAELIRGFAEAGLRISVTEQGVPAGDAAQQLAVYRIVQESLTNALRYAGAGADVELKLIHGDLTTEIEVVDSGPDRAGSGTPAAPHDSGARRPIPGSGRG
ncbi:sensor histidine kinase, partial [Leucobacter soli]